MSDNDLVPCSLGQICKKEVFEEPEYTIVWITPMYKEGFLTIQDCRKGYGTNYYFLDNSKFKQEGHFILMDKVTLKYIRALDYYNFMFGASELMELKWQPKDWKYVAIEQSYHLGAYQWIYRQEKIKTEKIKTEKIKTEEVKAEEVKPKTEGKE